MTVVPILSIPKFVCLVPDSFYSRFMEEFQCQESSLPGFLQQRGIVVIRCPDHVYPFEQLHAQVRFPKSKSKRIRKKWRKNTFNYVLRNNPSLTVINEDIAMRNNPFLMPSRPFSI
jgi:hypothetical protein